MRIALIAFGSRGDVEPLIALALRLRRDGHDPVIGASPGFDGWVRGYGIGFRPVGRDIEVWIREHGARLVGNPLRLMPKAMEYLRDEIELGFEHTLTAARGADLIVSGVHGAAPSVAEAMGVPHRLLLYCPQMIPSRHHTPMGLPWVSLPAPLNAVLWRGCGRGFDLGLGPAINAGRRQLHTILATDPLLGAIPDDAPVSVTQTGSMRLDDRAGLDPELEAFLDAGEPPISIGFGSMGDHDPRRTTRALVEALNGRRAVLLSGWADLGDATLPPNVFVARTAPHGRLLPRVAIAIHHGGAGTTAAAARAGVPQIVVPHVADQFYWGRQVWTLGLGSAPLRRDRLTAAALRGAIEYVGEHAEIAARARDVGARLRNTDGAGRVAELLDRAIPEDREERFAA